jgi:hypothetical protein
VFLDNLLYDGGVSESGDISQLIMSASCYLPQNTTHYLPGAGLGQTWDYKEQLTKNRLGRAKEAIFFLTIVLRSSAIVSTLATTPSFRITKA